MRAKNATSRSRISAPPTNGGSYRDGSSSGSSSAAKPRSRHSGKFPGASSPKSRARTARWPREKSRTNGGAKCRRRCVRRSTGSGRTTSGSRPASANVQAGKPDGPPCFRGQRFPRSSPTPFCAHPSCMRRRAVASDARATSHRQGRHSCFAICADIDLDLPRRPLPPSLAPPQNDDIPF